MDVSPQDTVAKIGQIYRCSPPLPDQTTTVVPPPLSSRDLRKRYWIYKYSEQFTISWNVDQKYKIIAQWFDKWNELHVNCNAIIVKCKSYHFIMDIISKHIYIYIYSRHIMYTEEPYIIFFLRILKKNYTSMLVSTEII